MKRRVVMNMNKTTSKGKVVRHCTKDSNPNTKSSEGSKGKRDKALHPTLKCHEEVMSRLSQCTPDCFYNEFDNLSDKTENYQPNLVTRKKHDQGKIRHKQACDSRRMVLSGLDFEAATKFNHDKGSHSPKTYRSKSVPTVHKSKLEDYVDYVPVKLSSKEVMKENQKQPSTKKSTHNFNSDKEKKSRTLRPTWDTLLKTDSKETIHSIKDKIALNSYANHDKNSVTDGSSTDLPVFKNKPTMGYIKDSNTLGKGDASNLNRIMLTNGANADGSNYFYGFEPVKTLDFLIKRLREKLCKQQNENLQNIISDMENVLLKISVNYETKPRLNQEDKKCVASTHSSSPHSVSKSVISSCINQKETNPRMDIHQLQTRLEESCIFLQSLCMKQRESCNSHTKEKELLTIQLAESRRLLAIAKSKEKDYEVTIGNLRLKVKEAESGLEQQGQYIRELNNIVTKLRSENQILHSHEDTIKKLNEKVKELAQEKETLNSNLKDLEIERLKFLLERKENLNPAYDNKTTEKCQRPLELELNLGRQLEDKDISSLSLPSEMNWSRDKNVIACSSQASSSPRHSPTPYNSWQHISAIYQQPANPLDKIPHTFHNLKNKYSKKDPSPLDLELDSDNSVWGDKDVST